MRPGAISTYASAAIAAVAALRRAAQPSHRIASALGRITTLPYRLIDEANKALRARLLGA
eukprot:6205595-Pleurochrysis_carterae.AAC.8